MRSQYINIIFFSVSKADFFNAVVCDLSRLIECGIFDLSTENIYNEGINVVRISI